VTWFFTITTAEDMMDSLLKLQDQQTIVLPDDFQQRSRETFRLYQSVLDHYLHELPRIQVSRETRQDWWEEFGRQQERFWQMWQSQFDHIVQRDLEILWQDPHHRLLEKTIPLTGVSCIALDHEFGDISLLGITGSDAHIEAHIRVVSPDQQIARRYADEIDIRAIAQDSILQVGMVYPEQATDPVEGISVSLRLELPRDRFLDVKNDFGNLRVDRFTRGLTARTRHGAMEIRECSGPLKLSNRDGTVSVSGGRGTLQVESSFHPISVAQFDGDVFATNQFGDIRVSQTGGDVQMENRAGAVEAFEIGGDVFLNNQLGQVLVRSVRGDLVLNNADSRVIVADILGETHIENRRGEIRAENLGDRVIIINREGDIDLALDDIREGSYRLDSSFGVVRLNLPVNLSALITAESRFGTIDSDFPLEISRAGDVQSAHGKLGQGAATIDLDAQHSNIYLISSGR
jgi:DUF4097 and DUF4098 domain-containing protein YvlB